MKGVHALVAEDSAHLIYLVHAADDQALEIKLRFDAHIHVDVQRVVVGLERAGVRADFQRQKDGGIHFEITPAVEIRPDFLQNSRARDKRILHLAVHDEIEVAETVFEVLILKPVIFFGQGKERLGEHDQLADVHRDFARLRLEYKALEAHDVADIVILFIGKIIFLADVLPGDVNLNRPAPVGDMRKGRLAHNAAGHHSARQGDGFSLVCLEIVFQRFGIRIYRVFHLFVRVFALRLKLCQLFAADFRLFDKFFFARFRRRGHGDLFFFHKRISSDD